MEQVVPNKYSCHILPFSTSYNYSIRNGLALSPTFHHAFDQGLIVVSYKYRVLVHPQHSAAVRPVGGSAAELLAY
jgi:predicted restriction endonuclease